MDLASYEFYRTDLGVLYCGDCLEIMPMLSQVDLVLTDPPYGINHPTNYASRGRGEIAQCHDYAPVHGDDICFDPKPFIKYKCVLFGANYYADRLPCSSGWLIWDKQRPHDIDQATCELAWTNFVKGVRIFRYLWHGCMRKGKEVLYHPTQKPVELVAWILNLKWTAREWLVIDPFFGSGTTGVACERLGRKWVGIEISEAYCEIAKRRIEPEAAQGKLFV